MTAVVLRGDARRLPLPDASVDLIMCSPPYFGLRDYRDGEGSLAGQIGSEATPGEWVAALVECTREWVRVLKPSGSIFVNLGDKYSGAQGPKNGVMPPSLHDPKIGHKGGVKWPTSPRGEAVPGMPPKSLLGLPWRYALACTDQLGLILRRDIIWHKVNGLPESVTDRCRSSHEYLFHLVKQPRYYAAVDEIREPQTGPPAAHYGTQTEAATTAAIVKRVEHGARGSISRPIAREYNPLGKLPGSVWKVPPDDTVWEIPSAPLTVPPHLGVDHFAAFPPALVRPVVLGWSPPGICTACGEGRRPVTTTEYTKPIPGNDLNGRRRNNGDATWSFHVRREARATITGYVCACTPYTDHPGTGSSGPRYGNALADGYRPSFPGRDGPPSRLSTRPKASGGREYHLDAWTPPPTRPAVVLDPFGGTGTTALVATVHGRHAITIDLSADYCRLAQWRVHDPGERARALGVPKPPPVPDGMAPLF